MGKAKSTLAQKMAVTSASVINGFSYPFLRLLVDRAKKSGDGLFTHPTLHMERGELSDIGYVILSHINAQLGERFEITGYINLDIAYGIIGTAEELLEIFEATAEDYGFDGETDE